MQNVIETIQPAINTIVTAIVGVLVTFALAGINTLKNKANNWLDARTTAAQRDVIHKVAGEAFALAQTTFKDVGGVRKMQEALQYASLRLTEQCIVVSPTELQAAIEKAYLEYKTKTKAVLATEAQPNEEAAQAAAKEAVSSLAAQVTAILSQATGAETMESMVPNTLQDTTPAPQANVTGVAVE
ncbi:phage holin, LLH family [Paenibacillus polymyxa]|uniref:phage holin, LLH family n=1 Tax=Paenibacillus polymyxa TaxID=1406 RepID=UPI0024BF682E|nr:phage holin, LLH family [Paenibacillus polymyxa]WHX37428.1 phage holin, LLH family [Paenibacillus polymyxa]